MKRELDVNDSELSNSLFLIFYSKCQFSTAGGRDNRYVHISPLTSIYEVMFIHPDLNCRYQNKVLIIYTLCTAPLTPPSWSLYSFIKINPPSKQFICLHIKILYLHDKSPQQRKCNVFFYVCNVHNGFVDEMHAELQ